MASKVIQRNGGTGVGQDESYTGGSSNPYKDSLAKAINDRLHRQNEIVAAQLKVQNENQSSTSSRVTEHNDASECCCQKTGDYFRHFFSKKPKTP